MLCWARHCRTRITETKEFCDRHWALLPKDYQLRLVEAYGTPQWGQEKQRCLQQLFLIESRSRDSRTG